MGRNVTSILDFGSSRITLLVGTEEVNKSFRLLSSIDYDYEGFAKGEFAVGETVAVLDGQGVRGVVPQRISVGEGKAVELMFRPASVYRNSVCLVKCGDTVIAKKKAPIFTPGEMVVVKLPEDVVAGLSGDLTVSVEGGQ